MSNSGISDSTQPSDAHQPDSTADRAAVKEVSDTATTQPPSHQQYLQAEEQQTQGLVDTGALPPVHIDQLRPDSAQHKADQLPGSHLSAQMQQAWAHVDASLHVVKNDTSKGVDHIIHDAVTGAADAVVHEAENHPVRFAAEVVAAPAIVAGAAYAGTVVAGSAALVGVGEATAALIGTGVDLTVASGIGGAATVKAWDGVTKIQQGAAQSQAAIDTVMHSSQHTPEQVAAADAKIAPRIGPGVLETASSLGLAGAAGKTAGVGRATTTADDLTIVKATVAGAAKPAGKLSSTFGDTAAAPKITQLADGRILNEWAKPTNLGTAYDNMTVIRVIHGPEVADASIYENPNGIFGPGSAVRIERGVNGKFVEHFGEKVEEASEGSTAQLWRASEYRTPKAERYDFQMPDSARRIKHDLFRTAIKYNRELIDLRKIWPQESRVLLVGEDHTAHTQVQEELLGMLPKFKKLGLTHYASEFWGPKEQPLVDAYARGEIPRSDFVTAMGESRYGAGQFDVHHDLEGSTKLIDASIEHGIKPIGLDVSNEITDQRLEALKQRTDYSSSDSRYHAAKNEIELDKREDQWHRIISDIVTTDSQARVLVHAGDNHVLRDPLRDSLHARLEMDSVSTSSFSFKGIRQSASSFDFATEALALQQDAFAVQLKNTPFYTGDADWIVHIPVSN